MAHIIRGRAFVCSESTAHFWHGLGQVPDDVRVSVVTYTSNDVPVFIVGRGTSQFADLVWTNFQAGASATVTVDAVLNAEGDDRVKEVEALSHVTGGQTVKQGTPDLRFYDFGTRQAAI